MIEIGDDNLRAWWCEDLPALPEWVISRRRKVQKRSCPDLDLETLEPVPVHV